MENSTESTSDEIIHQIHQIRNRHDDDDDDKDDDDGLSRNRERERERERGMKKVSLRIFFKELASIETKTSRQNKKTAKIK